MRKYYFVFILIIGITNSIKSQSFIDIYDKGFILSNNDTLECFVKIQSSYENYILYKLDKDGEKIDAKIDTINFIITDYNSYGRVRYKNKKTLSRILCWGRINYYECVTHTPPKGDPSKGWAHEAEIFTYYIEKDNIVIRISMNKVSDEIKMLFRDNESIFERINSKKIKREKLLELIQEYNDAH
jgi:hypothetical protein